MSGSVSSVTPSSVIAANGTTATSNDALASLTSNFNDFLNLLMTQLQNQDPTSPMDTSTFTTELVQFAGVEQQINTNSSLTQLISLSQGEETVQASSLVGKAVDVASTSLPLQNSTATVDYTATQNEPVEITISDSSGNVIRSAQVTATGTSNSWTWDGTSNSGVQEPDGTYSVAVSDGAPGSTTSLPFTVKGTVTGVVNTSGTVDLQLGSMSTDFSNIRQVSNGS